MCHAARNLALDNRKEFGIVLHFYCLHSPLLRTTQSHLRSNEFVSSGPGIKTAGK